MKLIVVGLLALLPVLAADEWTMLFDGKDLSHWSGGIGEAFPGDVWKIEDGLLTNPKRPGGSLYTVRPYGEFELEWEWKISQGGNSGVKYLAAPGRMHPDYERLGFAPLRFRGFSALGLAMVCGLVWWRMRSQVAVRFLCGMLGAGCLAYCAYVGKEYWVLWGEATRRPPGLEYQMLDDANNKEGKLPTHRTGSLYDLLAAKPEPRKAAGEWNQSRVVVMGKKVEHWLNGEKVLEYELGSEEMRAAVEKSKFRTTKGFGEAGAGLIEIQHHGDRVWLKMMRVRER